MVTRLVSGLLPAYPCFQILFLKPTLPQGVCNTYLIAQSTSFYHSDILTLNQIAVKQAIAFQRIIPFYKFFSYQNEHLQSPGGALFLHWIFSIIPLAAFGTNADARQFAAGIYSYGYQVVNSRSTSVQSVFVPPRTILPAYKS